MISDNNKTKRVDFARMCLDTNDDFSNVIWTDESSVQLRRHSQTMRVKVWKERTLKPQAKHTIKVHVWAGISMRGATKICIFDQVMDAPLYIGILREFLLPFIKKQFPGCEYRFMQDNDPKHTSRKAREFYEEEGINWWPTPASSADINQLTCGSEGRLMRGMRGWLMCGMRVCLMCERESILVCRRVVRGMSGRDARLRPG